MTKVTIPTETVELIAANHASASMGPHVVIGSGAVVLPGTVLEG
jgi:acetyltransferase-like isoleucine patch superfamily enzyme